MRWSDRHPLAVLLLMASLAAAQDRGGTAPAVEPSAPPAGKKSPVHGKKAEAAAPADAPASEAATAGGALVDMPAPSFNGVDKMLPIGRSAEKLVIPSLDEAGRLVSVTKIAKLTRTEEDKFLLETVRTVSYDYSQRTADGAPLVTSTEFVDGVYDRTKQTLTSEKRVSILKPTTSVTGDGLDYSVPEGKGRILRNVRTVIRTEPKPAPAEPTPAPDTPKPTPPVQ